MVNDTHTRRLGSQFTGPRVTGSQHWSGYKPVYVASHTPRLCWDEVHCSMFSWFCCLV